MSGAWINKERPYGNKTFMFEVYKDSDKVMVVEGNRAKNCVHIDTGPYRVRYKVFAGSDKNDVRLEVIDGAVQRATVIIETVYPDVLVASHYDEFLELEDESEQELENEDYIE